MVTALRKHFGKILAVSGVVAMVLAVVGYRTGDPSLTWDTLIYRGVNLFHWGYSAWGSEGESPLHWTLSVARWLAPMVLMGTLFGVALTVFQKQWEGWWASRMRGHTIVCGAGEKGRLLAASLREKNIRLVLIESHLERAEMLSKEGFLTVHGDATDPSSLRRAGAGKASRLVALTGDDHDNLAISVAAAQVAGSGASLSIFLHSGDLTLCDLYQRNRALTATMGGVPVKVFNHYRNVARQTLQEFPPDPGEGEAHLVLHGVSRVGLALLVEHALVGHYPGERRTHLHLAGRQAARDLLRLRVKYPAIDQCANLSLLEIQEGERFSTRVAALVREHSCSDSFAICPSIEDDNEAFGHALELHEMLSNRSGIRILLDTPPGAAVRRLVEESAELRLRICFLPMGESASGYEAVIGEALDRMARMIHENWLVETRKQIAVARAAGDEVLVKKHEAKSTYREWDELNEEQKGANRSQADHIAFKIRAVGLDPKTVSRKDWEKLTAEQVESLARLEHARWAAYYWMTGWTFAAQRNDAKKQHPNLVPYDELDEPAKDYDRAAVRHLSEYLPL